MKSSPQAAWLVLAVLVAGIPWVIWPPWVTRDPYIDIKWPAAALGVAVFAAASYFHQAPAISLASIRRSRFLLGFWTGAILVLVGLAISAILSPAPGLGFQITLRESVLVLAALRISSMQIDRKRLLLLFGLYILSASLQACLTLHQWQSSGGLRASMLGTIGNPEYLAGWLATAFCSACIWTNWPATSRGQRAAAGIAALPIGLALILSGGRGAALGAAAGLGAAWIVQASIRKGAASNRAKRSESSDRPEISEAPRKLPARAKTLIPAAGAVALIIILGIALGPQARRQSIFGRTVEMFDPYSISIRHRIGLMVVTSRMIFRNPIVGCGPGRFGAAFDIERGEMARASEGIGAWVFNDIMSDQTATEAHCDPLQWWAEYGFLPLLGLALMISSSLGGGAGPRGRRSVTDKHARASAAARNRGRFEPGC